MLWYTNTTKPLRPIFPVGDLPPTGHARPTGECARWATDVARAYVGTLSKLLPIGNLTTTLSMPHGSSTPGSVYDASKSTDSVIGKDPPIELNGSECPGLVMLSEISDRDKLLYDTTSLNPLLVPTTWHAQLATVHTAERRRHARERPTLDRDASRFELDPRHKVIKRTPHEAR